MDEALLQVGLPVKCKRCGVKGSVKPRTDYNGWFRWRLMRGASRWYCPEHAPLGVVAKQNMEVAMRAVQEPEQEELSSEEALYALLD